MRYYPFVLGAQPVRLIDLAAFYAAIANEGAAPGAARDRVDRAQRPADLPARAQRAGADRLGRSRGVLSVEVDPAGRGRSAAPRASIRRHCAVRRRQDRHDRQRERRLVRRLHQRRDGRRVGRLRQCRRQAPHARPRPDRRQGRGPDLRDRSSRRCGTTTRRRPHWRRRRPRRSASSPPCRSISTSGDAAGRPRQGQGGVHGVFPRRPLRPAPATRSISWCRASRSMPIVAIRRSGYGQVDGEAVRRLVARTRQPAVLALSPIGAIRRGSGSRRGAALFGAAAAATGTARIRAIGASAGSIRTISGAIATRIDASIQCELTSAPLRGQGGRG